MSQTTLELFDRVVTETTKKLPPEFIQYTKERIESHQHALIDTDFDSFEINIVIDTNVAISVIKYHVEKKQSIIFKLKQNPVFSIYAPRILKKEIIQYIEKHVEECHKQKWFKGLQLLEKVIKYKDIDNTRIKNQAIDVIGDRDIKDAPFVEVYIKVGAQAILTFDNDFEHQDLRIFDIKDLENTVCTFQKGMFSFFLINDSLPTILNFLKDVVIMLVNILFDALKNLFKIIKSAFHGIISHTAEFIKDLPGWAKILAVMIIIAIITIIAISKDARKKISEGLSSTINTFKNNIDKIFLFMKKIIKSLIYLTSTIFPHAITVIKSLDILLKNIKKMENELKNIMAETIA